MSMGRDDVSEMRPPTGLLFIPQMIYEYGESQCSDIERRKATNLQQNLSYCRVVHKSHVNCHGARVVLLTEGHV
jgi:hypothetical protein